ncbi:hypothetical protein B0H10DRAFT_1923354 [Mycena sp. CBHHK59/15]|nr:hypothetical protein B0H10DRAFT_1923354 [Mycena sp. CBHHK59/15]
MSPSTALPCSSLTLPDPTMEPGLTELLLSNVPPRPSQISMVLAKLKDTEDDLSLLDEQIDAIQCAMNELLTRRDALREKSARYKSVVSPIRILPNEILSEIFMHCASQDEGLCLWKSTSSVCKRWRHVTLYTPRLWSFLDLTASHYHMRMPSNIPIVQAVTEHLIRSGNCPLSIKYDSRIYEDYLGLERTPSLLELLARFSYRWQDISLHIGRVPNRFNGLRGKLPSLRRLTLGGAGLPEIREVFAVAPLLRHLELDAAYGIPPALSLPWSQITHCIVINCQINITLDILRRVSNAVDFTADRIADVFDIDGFTPIFSPVHSLETINSAELLGRLTTPQLKNLTIRDERWNILADQAEALINRSSCSLTRLTLHNVRLSDVQFIRLLKLTPDLRELDLLSSGILFITDDFIDALTPTVADSPCLATKLESLSITILSTNSDKPDYPNSALVLNMIARRREDHNSCVALSTVRLVFPRDVHPNDHARAARLRRGGLNLSLEARYPWFGLGSAGSWQDDDVEYL